MNSLSQSTAFDPVARTAPDALVADGSNFFAYCGYDPVNCVDPMGGWKVPRPIPLPNEGKTEATVVDMPAEVVTVHRPSDSSDTQTSVEDILDEVPVSTWNPQPPTLQDMREADWSGQGGPDPVVSPGPDVEMKDAGGGIVLLGMAPASTSALVLQRLSGRYFLINQSQMS